MKQINNFSSKEVQLIESVQNILRYTFAKPSLLLEALTHASFSAKKQREQNDNQRLEFLGDAVLELCLTEILYKRFDTLQEGALTEMRAALVSKKNLYLLAQKLSLGVFLRMGNSEEAAGGRKKAGALADVFEALLGALFLDAGWQKTREWIYSLFALQIEELNESEHIINPKGQLQEILQAIYPAYPIYTLLSQKGPSHAQTFTSQVSWLNGLLGKGQGKSKKEAEIAAARQALASELWTTIIPPKNDS